MRDPRSPPHFGAQCDIGGELIGYAFDTKGAAEGRRGDTTGHMVGGVGLNPDGKRSGVSGRTDGGLDFDLARFVGHRRFGGQGRALSLKPGLEM